MWIPLILFLGWSLLPFYRKSCQLIQKKSSLIFDSQWKRECSATLKEYLEEEREEECLPPLTDHKGVSEDGAQHLINLLKEP